MIKKFMKNTGLDRYIRPFYENYRVWRADSKQKISISGTEAEFIVQSASDLWWLNTEDLGGERNVIRDIIEEIDRNEVFYDVGANIGLYSVLIASLDREINVFAFEPTPDIRKRCEANRDLNGQDFDVSDIAFSDDDSDGQITNYDKSTENKVATKFRKGDTLLRDGGFPCPDIMKIDVNDLEYEVLSGFSEALERNDIRAIYVEIHSNAKQDRRGTKKEELYELLEDCGYSIITLDDSELDYHIKATV